MENFTLWGIKYKIRHYYAIIVVKLGKLSQRSLLF